jgi:hypothetical protein
MTYTVGLKRIYKLTIIPTCRNFVLTNIKMSQGSKRVIVLQRFANAKLEEVPEPIHKLLEGYSRIPSDQIYSHVVEVVR